MNLLDKIKPLFQQRPRLIAAVVVVTALSLPFVINQVLKQQDIRQHADTAPSITFNFSPATGNIDIGQTLSVDFLVNASTNDIGALHFKMTYDPTLLQVTDTAYPSNLKTLTGTKTNTNGVFEETMTNIIINPVTGNAVKLVTFQFKALKAGNATVTVDSGIQATSQYADTYVPVDGNTNTIGKYTLGSTTGVTDNCPATNKPDECACTVNSDCASNNCESANTGVAASADGVNGVCKPRATVSASPSPSPSPSPTADCTANANRQNGCSCDSNPVCFSQYCVGTGTIAKTCQNPGWTPPVTSASPSPTPVSISCSSSGTSVTYDMKSPISGKTTGTITGIDLTSGNWCAWAAGNEDPNSQGRCPLSCPVLNPTAGTTSVTPLSLSSDKMSFSSAFDSYYADNTGSCTYKVTCTAANSSPTTTTTQAPTATATQIPTETVAPGETGIKLSLKLPGIGKTSGDNASPIRTTRTTTVSVFNSLNTEIVHQMTGTLEYNATNGYYEGAVGIGTSIPSGSYTVKVKMDNTLYKRLPGIVAITSGKADNTTPQAKLVSGDLNQDNALGVEDYTTFLACFQGNSTCTGDIAIKSDINDNGNVNGDNDDQNILQYNYTNRLGD